MEILLLLILVLLILIGAVVEFYRINRMKSIDPFEQHIKGLITQYRETTPENEQSVIGLNRFLAHHNIVLTHVQLVSLLIYYFDGYLVRN